MNQSSLIAQVFSSLTKVMCSNPVLNMQQR